MTKHADVAEKIKKAWSLYEKGFSVARCAKAVVLPYCTVLRSFRRMDDSICRRKPTKSKALLCSRCKNPPTERDRGRLTSLANRNTGFREALCSACMTNTEEDDVKAVRKRFFEKDCHSRHEVV